MKGLMPTKEELASIEIGSFVKIEMKGKRFWIEIQGLMADRIFGVIDSEDVEGVVAGQEVSFTREDILTIFY